MMKSSSVAFLFFLPSVLFGQLMDSAAIKQVDSLIKVSRALTNKSEFDKALEVNAAAEKIVMEKLGQTSAAYGSICFNHGRILDFKGAIPEAEKWYLDSKAIREKTLGKQHPDYAWSLNNLAILYNDIGDKEKAEQLHLEAKAIREKALGKQHPDYATSLNNLAALYSGMGDYEKAEPLYLEAKAIREKALGKQHPDYAASLNNLADLYKSMGNYEKAELLLLEAKAIWGEALGKSHPYYAYCLSNLAVVYKYMGDYEKAEPLQLEAKDIREKALGKEHPAYTFSLISLANLYNNMLNYEKAEPLLLEAKAIQEKMSGTEQPNYALILGNLAALYSDMGNYKKAEPLSVEAIATKEKILGKEHPDYALSLNNLADIYCNTGNYVKAEPLFFEVNAINKTLMLKALHHLSEQELNSYLKKYAGNQDQVLSFAQRSGSKKVVPVCYDNSLFYKGFLLNAANQVKRLALSDAATTEKFKQLKSFEHSLAAEYVKPIAERDSSKVAALEEKANGLEKDLVRTVAGYGEAIRQVNWKEVQQKLKADEAAIEFIHYRFFEKNLTDSILYAALVLLPNAAQPVLVPLFEEKQLDSLLQTNGERRADYVNGLYTVAERGAKPLGKPQKSLYELLWMPLEKELANAKTIYFSPSGLLHRLNLGAIPINDEQTLADRYRLVALGSTRQLVVGSPQLSAGNRDALLFGGVQYDMDSTAIAQSNTAFGNGTLASSKEDLSFTYSSPTNRIAAWAYLKWTEKEVGALEPILKTSGIETAVRRSYAATEASFKTISNGKLSPRILHIATHGFFFPDPKNQEEGRGLGNDEPVFKISDNPMIRSGLILAGGNYAWQAGKPLAPGMEDGILTAYEISQMNLSNTELVVLSACETGLGDIEGNEGVYGLQRSFKIAGAKYLMMSLWQVPDQETSVFMTTFYKNWLAGKMTIPDAFRTTQQEMRERFINPYQWAGFVLVE